MRFTFLLIIAVVAIVGGVLALQFSKKEPELAPAPVVTIQEAPKTEALKTSDVLVAKSAIPVGVVITDAMVDVQPWPRELAARMPRESSGGEDSPSPLFLDSLPTDFPLLPPPLPK